MKLTSEMRSVAMQAKSVEELLKLAEENGYSVSKEEAEEIYAEFSKEVEIADEELENVTGGGCGALEIDSKDPKCPSCGGKIVLVQGFHEDQYDLHQCQDCKTKYKREYDGDEWYKY